MTRNEDPLAHIQTRRHLEEINHHLLNEMGEIVESPGKISLVWTDPVYDQKRYIAVKAAGDSQVMINGRLYPATEDGLEKGLHACLKESLT